jgi:hypothetical protein
MVAVSIPTPMATCPQRAQGGQDVGGEEGRGRVWCVQEAFRRLLALPDGMGVQGVEGLQARGLQRFFVAFEAFAGGIEVADVTDEGDALVAVVDEVFRRLPRALAVLDQHRVGADALRGPVEGDDGKPGRLLRLEVAVVSSGGDDQEPVDLALREEPYVVALLPQVSVRVAEDEGVAVLAGDGLDGLGADGHERVRDVVYHQAYGAGALPFEGARQLVRPVAEPLYRVGHPGRRRLVDEGFIVYHPGDGLDRDPSLAGDVAQRGPLAMFWYERIGHGRSPRYHRISRRATARAPGVRAWLNPTSLVLCRRLDHRSQQVLYGLYRVFGEARVDRGRLHDGAAGRDEPAEALDWWQQADGAGLGSALAYEARDLEVRPDDLGVEVGVERPQAFGVEVDAGVEELLVLAVKHDPGVYELSALDAWHYAQKGVLEEAHRAASSSARTQSLGSRRRALR